MEIKKLNCEKMACPMPVIKTKQELEGIEKGALEVTVDNKTAKENLLKLAASLEMAVELKEEENLFKITFIKTKEGSTNQSSEKEVEKVKIEAQNEVVLIGSNLLGSGDEELGRILMKGFIYTLSETKPYPKKMLFINTGVKLTAENEEAIENLKKMEAEGVEILSCGTCLDFYNIKDNLAVGRVANMYDIVEALKQNPNRLAV